MLNECYSSPLKVWSNQPQGNLSAPLSSDGSPDSLGWDVEKGWSDGSHQVGDTLEFHGKGRHFPPPSLPFQRGINPLSGKISDVCVSLVWHFCEQIPFFLICRPVEWYLGWETIFRDYLSQLISWWIKKQVQRGGVLPRY